jgi:dienelactone hydrolase
VNPLPCIFPLVMALLAAPAARPATTTASVRGKPQVLRLYGPEDGDPAVVASGDGGFVHLAPQVSEVLASRGFFVVGVDSKAYLSSFTTREGVLSPSDVTGDFRVFVDAARRGRTGRALLVGISEGGGLSVLAAADASLQDAVLGILGLGLPEVNELGWRFRDSIIYLTKRSPDEPLFHASDYVVKLGAVPLAAIHSRHDEFVPLDVVEHLVDRAAGPHHLWTIDAADHRFSDRPDELAARIDEAVAWIREQRR